MIPNEELTITLASVSYLPRGF